jgi:hypothetical protein
VLHVQPRNTPLNTNESGIFNDPAMCRARSNQSMTSAGNESASEMGWVGLTPAHPKPKTVK